MGEIDESGNAWDKAVRDAAHDLMMDRIRFGFCAVGPDGKRIDPTQLTPHGEQSEPLNPKATHE